MTVRPLFWPGKWFRLHSGTTRKKVNVEFDILGIINQLDKVSGIFKQNIVFLGAA